MEHLNDVSSQNIDKNSAKKSPNKFKSSVMHSNSMVHLTSHLGPVLGPVQGGDIHIPNDINALDISVKKLQNKAKAEFFNYELTNKKQKAR